MQRRAAILLSTFFCLATPVRADDLSVWLRKKLIGEPGGHVLLSAPPEMPALPPARAVDALPKPEIAKAISQWSTSGFNDGDGRGISVGATAGLGAGEFLEGVRFGNTLNYYCGLSGIAGYDVSATVAGTTIKTSAGCDKPETYAGGFLSFNLGIGTPVEHLGVGAALSLGVDNDKVAEHLPKLVNEIRALFDKHGDDLMAKLQPAIQASFDKKDQLAGNALLVRLLASIYRSGDATRKDITTALMKSYPDQGKELSDFFLSGGRKFPSVKGRLEKLREELAKTQPELAQALGHLTAMLTSCDSLSANVNGGVSAVPVSATLSYSNYVYLGGMGSPIDAERAKAALPALAMQSSGLMDAPKKLQILQSTVDTEQAKRNLETQKKLALLAATPAVTVPLLCTSPALEPACKLARAMEEAKLSNIPGAALRTCEEMVRLRQRAEDVALGRK